MSGEVLKATFGRSAQNFGKYFCFMMQAPFFSVITVSYNSAHTIGRTAHSLQAYPAEMLEWLVIDGASTDDTLLVLKQGHRVPNLLVSEKDEGLYDAMNKGVQLAKGQYLLFLNSDDWLEPGILHLVQEKINAQPGYDVYHGQLKAHFEKHMAIQQAHGKWPTSMPAFQPASFIRRNLQAAYPWFDLQYRIAADFKFFKQLQLNGQRFYAFPFVVTNYSTDGASSDDAKRIAELKRILPELGYGWLWSWLFILRMKLAQRVL